jgi:hypothetical protein
VSNELYVNDGAGFEIVPTPISPGWWWDIGISPTTEMKVIVSHKAVCVFENDQWEVYDSEDGVPSQAQCVIVDRNENIWVGTQNGLAVLWRDSVPQSPILVILHIDPVQYIQGQEMGVNLSLQAQTLSRTADFYVALQMPSGDMHFYPSFGTAMVPFMSGVEIPAGTHIEDYELFTLTLPDLPAGTYTWYAACTYAGTMEFASNVASCDWQFVK